MAVEPDAGPDEPVRGELEVLPKADRGAARHPRATEGAKPFLG